METNATVGVVGTRASFEEDYGKDSRYTCLSSMDAVMGRKFTSLVNNYFWLEKRASRQEYDDIYDRAACNVIKPFTS